jgi:hypothetical protein
MRNYTICMPCLVLLEIFKSRRLTWKKQTGCMKETNVIRRTEEVGEVATLQTLIWETPT